MSSLISVLIPNRNSACQRGLTLIELMVAMAIGLVVMASMVKVYVDSSRLYRFNDEFSQMQANGRFALEFMRRDARLAGFWGCNRNADLKNLVAVGATNRRSYTNVDDSTNPFDVTKGSAIEGKDDDSLTAWTHQISAWNESDTITFRGATSKSLSLSADIPAGVLTADVELTSSDHGIESSDTVLISDCYEGDIFEVTGTPGSNIPHGVTFSKAYKKGESGLYPVHENEYCIAPGIDGVTPALRRLRYPRKTGGALECAVHGDSLIEGAENLQILYGVDTDGTADGIANKYIPWSDDVTVLKPERIVSVRISLLLRSINNSVTEDPQPFTYMGTTTTPPATDRFLRRVFNATISLRNGVIVSGS